MDDGPQHPDPAHLAALCAGLRAVVDGSAAIGNPAAASWTGFGHCVQLAAAAPIAVADTPDAAGCDLGYVPVDDPHYWRGEVRCRTHAGWCVVVPLPRSPDDPLDPVLAALPRMDPPPPEPVRLGG